MSPDGLYNANGKYLRKHRSGAKTDEWQRNTRNWHDTNAHANILKHLKCPHGNTAHKGEFGKGIVKAHRKKHRRENHPCKERQHNQRTDETKLFRKKRKYEIGVCFGEKATACLGGIACPFAKKTTGPNGNFCLL